MSNDSTKKMIVVALAVCLVCSVFVSMAAVSLSGRQQQNKELDKIKNIIEAGELSEPGKDAMTIYAERIEPALVELASGRLLPQSDYNAKLDPKTFNTKDMADDAEYGQVIPANKDIAHINTMPKVMPIYMIKENGAVSKYILPIYGKGLWSTLWGFLALDRDLHTIRGITFYEHGETPGLGGEVDNPRWKDLWKGKQAYDEQGNVAITVIKGKVDPSDPDSNHEVDGLSGSTLTTRGVDQLVKFWLGENGYGPFIQQRKNQEEGINEQG